MKTLVASGSSYDSTLMIYKLLTETDDELIVRMSYNTTTRHRMGVRYQLAYMNTMKYMSETIRPFDYDMIWKDHAERYTIFMFPGWRDYNLKKWDGLIGDAKDYVVDRLAIAYNTDNLNPATWYFQEENPDPKPWLTAGGYPFVDPNHPRAMVVDNKFQSALLRSIGDFLNELNIEVVFPLLSDKSPEGRANALGRWQIYEKVRDELPDLFNLIPKKCDDISYNKMLQENTCTLPLGPMNSPAPNTYCDGCLSYAWYNYMAFRGYTAKEMDDKIMKDAEYGRYFVNSEVLDFKKRGEFYERNRSEILAFSQSNTSFSLSSNYL